MLEKVILETYSTKNRRLFQGGRLVADDGEALFLVH